MSHDVLSYETPFGEFVQVGILLLQFVWKYKAFTSSPSRRGIFLFLGAPPEAQIPMTAANVPGQDQESEDPEPYTLHSKPPILDPKSL